MTQYNGFPKEGIKFLQDLAQNNNRDWFNDHKTDYQTFVRDPAVELIGILGERLKAELFPNIIYDTRTNGAGSLTRINRDTRFSPDKSPYKTSIGLIFWEGGGKKFENPAIDIHLGADECFMRAGIHMFPKQVLAAYRDAVVDNEMGGTLEEAILSVRDKAGLRIGGEHFKRVPRGFDPEHPRADLLRYNGIGSHSAPVPFEKVTSSEIVDICMDYCRKHAPLHQWMVKLFQHVG